MILQASGSLHCFAASGCQCLCQHALIRLLLILPPHPARKRANPVRRKTKSCEGGQNCERKTTNAVQETDETARGKGKTRGKQHPTWFSWLLSWVQRADQESYTCYVLFVLIFILDFSLLTMLFPVSLAAYALATQRPSRLYWQVSLFVCCAVLCCAVLCCAVLCCAVLCCATVLPCHF